MTGSAYYQRLYSDVFNGGPSTHIMSRVDDIWRRHPWMVNAYTGRDSLGDQRMNDVLWWLHETFGRGTWPFGDEPDWRKYWVGGGTVNGWTWIGFTTEDDMNQFVEKWPAPCEEPQSDG